MTFDLKRIAIAAAAAIVITVFGAYAVDLSVGDGSDAEGAIVAKGFAFAPASLTVGAGEVIKVANQDSTAHTITSTTGGTPDGRFTEDLAASGGTAEITLDEAGTYEYFCAIHPSMKGTIEVTG